MAFINDEVFDQGLDWAITNGTRLDICSADPGGTYSSVTTNTVGNETSPSVGATADNSPDGRKVTIAAITAGNVTATSPPNASHWALTNGTDTVVASGALSSAQAVTSGNTFTLDAIDIAIRDAT